MNQIGGITSDAKQLRQLVLPDGSTCTFNIEYKPQQYGWFITSLVYGSIEIDGLRIMNSPNMLRQWLKLLPFGICCQTTDGQEPTLQTAFSSGYASLYLLTQDQVTQYEGYLSGKVPT